MITVKNKGLQTKEFKEINNIPDRVYSTEEQNQFNEFIRRNYERRNGIQNRI
jgi:hypothetical protein